ncbi:MULTISPECIES: hypothetical protein [Bacillus cereus group]|uniref:hypothetical protein n=1 Tax=Bacillus cereus group TaxID=86661 RepID=UPI0018CFE49B|nr:hypothetical protein [Bacillus thuringiensis]MBG9503710.1 hypothetical protein [Bacillus thuringiensis]MBG9504233.1 hypothetical protein [Bacillus thuringiensis]
MKKFLKMFAGLFITFVLIILVAIIFNKNYHTKFESLNETDQRMLQELSTIYKNFEESSDKLWNGKYHFEKKPLILIRTNKDGGMIRKEAYAINVKQIEDSVFAKEIQVPKSLHLPKVYRLSRFDLGTLSTWFPSNFGTVDISNNQIFYLKYYPKMFSNPDLYFDFPSFLLHESFHAYKQKDWAYDANGGEYIDDYPVNKENYALMGLEFKLLDRAMMDNNPETLKQVLYDWTIVRNYRYKKWPQLVGETKAEAMEGSARYLEYRYSKLTGGTLTVLAKKENPYHVTFMEAFNFIANGQAESPSFLERDIRYETGSALELIMDKANVPWKEAIEDSSTKRGKTQYEILNEYFKINDSSINESRIQEIKESNNYEILLEQGRKLVGISSSVGQ